MNALVSQAN